MDRYVPMSLLPNCLPPVSRTSACRYQRYALENTRGQMKVPLPPPDTCIYETGQLNHPLSSLSTKEFLKYSQPYYPNLCQGCTWGN